MNNDENITIEQFGTNSNNNHDGNNTKLRIKNSSSSNRRENVCNDSYHLLACTVFSRSSTVVVRLGV
ncbi:Hypothetical predicted protein [Octopus vulgaris]|uniref:Uncharacterized protein n=1 Tax=Octopus vulgaris TaxID=6645 RepID=A0AA36B6W9_OCTVU|nr:Hypothetical predicted protein [Octopus vulgaris]